MMTAVRKQLLCFLAAVTVQFSTESVFTDPMKISQLFDLQINLTKTLQGMHEDDLLKVPMRMLKHRSR